MRIANQSIAECGERCKKTAAVQVFCAFIKECSLGLNMAISRQRYLFDEPGTYYIDLAASTSLQERKLHRQFGKYNVMGGLIKDRNNESTIEINSAPDTWVTKAAVKRAKKLYDKMVKKNIGDMGKTMARWHDFRVCLDENMVADSTGSSSNIVLPVDAAGAPLWTGTDSPEHYYSVFHTEDINWDAETLNTPDRNADSFRPMITGVHKAHSDGTWQRVSLIQSWFESRKFLEQDEPITAQNDLDDPLLNLFDVSDVLDEVVEEVSQNGDYPPYPLYGHFGMLRDATTEFTTPLDSTPLIRQDVNLQRQAMGATQAGAGAISTINGFGAICGLIQVVVEQAAGDGRVELVLDVDTEFESL